MNRLHVGITMQHMEIEYFENSQKAKARGKDGITIVRSIHPLGNINICIKLAINSWCPSGWQTYKWLE